MRIRWYKLLVGLAIAANPLSPVTRAHAEDSTVPTAGAQADARPLALDGVSGVWLPLDMSRSVLLSAQREPLYVRQISLLESQLELTGQQVTELKGAVDAETERGKELEKSIADAEDRAAEAEGKASAWYRAPGLWFGVGVVVGVVSVVLPVVLVR